MGQCWLLHRVNPERNEKRYYYLSWGSSLLYPCAITRHWGRIGGSQQQLLTPCNSAGEAEKLAAKLLKLRYRRGYTLVEGDNDEKDELAKES